MQDPSPSPSTASHPNGRVPDDEQAVTLRAHVDTVMRALAIAGKEAEGAPSAVLARLAAKHAPQVDAAMFALSEALAGFLYSDPRPANLEFLRSEFLTPLLSLSHSLPVYRRAEEVARHDEERLELTRLTLEGRLTGFDIQSLLLEEYYQNTLSSQALRVRASALLDRLIEEGRRQGWPEAKEMRVLVLRATSILSLATPTFGSAAAQRISMMIVDRETQPLRLARQAVEEVLGIRPGLLRAKPESLAQTRAGMDGAFDIVYTLFDYDLLSDEAALDLTRSLAGILKPGGALVTGTFHSSLPEAYRALANVMVGMDYRCWDEAGWRNLLGQLPFDLAASRFELVHPATLLVVARRSGQAEPG